MKPFLKKLSNFLFCYFQIRILFVFSLWMEQFTYLSRRVLLSVGFCLELYCQVPSNMSLVQIALSLCHQHGSLKATSKFSLFSNAISTKTFQYFVDFFIVWAYVLILLYTNFTLFIDIKFWLSQQM